jgi:hypothetical protein
VEGKKEKGGVRGDVVIAEANDKQEQFCKINESKKKRK